MGNTERIVFPELLLKPLVRLGTGCNQAHAAKLWKLAQTLPISVRVCHGESTFSVQSENTFTIY